MQGCLGSSRLDTFCVELTIHSPPPPPLLPAPTLSAGESKVSRRLGLPRSSRAPRSKPKTASIFGGLLETPVLCRHGGATGFLLRSYSPCRCLRDGYRIWVCRLRFWARRVLSLRPPSPSYATSSAPPPPWQNRRSRETSWTLSPKPMAIRQMHTETKTVFETVRSIHFLESICSQAPDLEFYSIARTTL